jgi:hypothetical protein
VLSALGLIEQQLGKEDPVLVAPRGKNDSDRAPRRVHLRADHAPIARQGIDALDQSTSAWSRFCQIPLVTRVPHPSTLGKITARCGPATTAALNTALLAKADAPKVIRTDRVRADTTVVAVNVAYATDSGLLSRAIPLFKCQMFSGSQRWALVLVRATIDTS